MWIDPTDKDLCPWICRDNPVIYIICEGNIQDCALLRQFYVGLIKINSYPLFLYTHLECRWI